MKILLVDDSDDMRRLVELFLKMLTHEIEVADDGHEAVQKFCSGQYDAVLMDMRMPGMDGYEATKNIRLWEKEQGRKATPIIALTAFSTQEEINKSLKAGCNSHLVKPVSRDSLQRVLSHFDALPETPEVSNTEAGQTICVEIDPDLQDLIPGYLEKRRQDVLKIEALLKTNDFEELRSIGHKIKGSGGGYGFRGLSEIGASLEDAAKVSQASGAQSALEQLKDYLERVEVIFSE